MTNKVIVTYEGRMHDEAQATESKKLRIVTYFNRHFTLKTIPFLPV